MAPSLFPAPLTPQSAMTPPMPKQMPYAKTATELLSDIAPELALRWCMQEASQTEPSCQRTFPATLYRALLSFLLRAASTHDASSTYDVLVRAMSLPLESPGACLGFASFHESGRVARVLTDLVTAAARDEALLQTGPALSLYATAGPGVGDVEEFHTAAADHRADFADAKEVLQDVRSASLAMAVELFAVAMEGDGETAHFLKDAVRHHAPFLAPFTDLLPLSVPDLHPSLRQALSRLYSAYLNGQTDAVREDIRSRLASSLMRLAVDKPTNLGLYIFSITDSEMRMSACRVCLNQRFGARDSIDNPLDLSVLLSTYLTIKPTSGRPNAAVPALLSGLIMGWFELSQANSFHVPGTGARKDAAVAAKLKALSKAMQRIAKSFGASKRDIATFNIAAIGLGNRIVEKNTRA